MERRAVTRDEAQLPRLAGDAPDQGGIARERWAGPQATHDGRVLLRLWSGREAGRDGDEIGDCRCELLVGAADLYLRPLEMKVLLDSLKLPKNILHLIKYCSILVFSFCL